ncbi:MerR family transcriptional regulator [Pseudomonas capeferrum]|uniref:MerR family transcriptional regulator n=1 Tax=Pseudomonas capeferrum TaxID=1495066 RepID=UPI0015E34CBC|nr:MerR family transcriptional regulator [Pseudomonas capeferrum]MBA1202550.1 MerR family transcriptional regulator [Pseudomonas capeferrum]
MNEQVPASLICSEFSELFPIREVSRLTGVNPVTLRAWERRHGLIQPTRTESGHRLYSLRDIDTVRTILGWLERGVAVSKVGSILARSEALTARLGASATADDKAHWQVAVRRAVHGFDSTRLDQLYGQVFANYPLAEVFGAVFMPVWQALREGPNVFGQSSEWLFLDHFLRARVLQRLQLNQGRQEHRVLVAPLPGPGHELELLVAGLTLGGDDIAVTVLAPGQPFEELALVCERLHPAALVLFSNQQQGPTLVKRLKRLGLGLQCPLLLAGEASELARASLEGTPVACLGTVGSAMRPRLNQFLAGHLDT